MFRNILVVEHSLQRSDKPFLAAVEFSKLHRSSIVDLSIVEPRLYNGSDEQARHDGALVERERRLVAHHVLDDHVTTARQAQLACKAFIVQSQTPSVEILNVARSEGCDVIFIAAQKRQGFFVKLLEESEMDWVIQHAQVPVLVFP